MWQAFHILLLICFFGGAYVLQLQLEEREENFVKVPSKMG